MLRFPIVLTALRVSMVLMLTALATDRPCSASPPWCESAMFVGNSNSDANIGRGVDISGDHAVATRRAVTVRGDTLAFVTAYRRDPVAGVWNAWQNLIPEFELSGDYVGNRAVIDGDTIAFTSSQPFPDRPADRPLSVFRLDRQKDQWVKEASLTSAHGALGTPFDTLVALGGNVLAASLPAGRVTVFMRDPSSGAWVEEPSLTIPMPPGYEAVMHSIATDGRSILVSASIGDYVAGNLCSCVFVYERDPAGAWSLAQTISNGQTGSDGDDLGLTMAMNEGVVVMAAFPPADDFPLLYEIHRRSEVTGVWAREAILPMYSTPISGYVPARWVDIDGDTVVIGDSAAPSSPGQGVARVFRRIPNTRDWRLTRTLAANSSAPSGHFGFSVGVSGANIIIGTMGWASSFQIIGPGAVTFFETGAGCASACLPDISPPGSPDGSIDLNDLLAVIGAWGACLNPADCPADIAPAGPPVGNDVVNVQDLLAVIAGWGTCP